MWFGPGGAQVSEWKAIENDIDTQFNRAQPVLFRYLESRGKTTTSYTLSVRDITFEPRGKRGFMPIFINGIIVEQVTAS